MEQEMITSTFKTAKKSTKLGHYTMTARYEAYNDEELRLTHITITENKDDSVVLSLHASCSSDANPIIDLLRSVDTVLL